jgi:hypothetical protein
MKYAGDMASGGMIYIPGFTNIGSSVQKLLGDGWIDRQTETHTEQGDQKLLGDTQTDTDTHTQRKVISNVYLYFILFYFFKIRKAR